MRASDLIKQSVSYAVNHLGEEKCTLVLGGNTYELTALITGRNQQTEQEMKRREITDSVTIRFVLPDGARQVKNGDKLIDTDGTSWFLDSIVSGIYNQVRCDGYQSSTSSLGNKHWSKEN